MGYEEEGTRHRQPSQGKDLSTVTTTTATTTTAYTSLRVSENERFPWIAQH